MVYFHGLHSIFIGVSMCLSVERWCTNNNNFRVHEYVLYTSITTNRSRTQMDTQKTGFTDMSHTVAPR